MSESPTLPFTWGWAKLHLPAAKLKAVGYYYRDRTAGYSFKILVNMLEISDDDAIREAARAKKYIANSTFRLGAHETLFAAAREGEMGVEIQAQFESGIGPAGPACAMVLMLTADEKKAYQLPDAMPGIEIYAR